MMTKEIDSCCCCCCCIAAINLNEIGNYVCVLCVWWKGNEMNSNRLYEN